MMWSWGSCGNISFKFTVFGCVFWRGVTYSTLLVFLFLAVAHKIRQRQRRGLSQQTRGERWQWWVSLCTEHWLWRVPRNTEITEKCVLCFMLFDCLFVHTVTPHYSDLARDCSDRGIHSPYLSSLITYLLLLIDYQVQVGDWHRWAYEWGFTVLWF